MSMLQKINNQIQFCNHNELVIKKWNENFLSNTARDVYWRYMPLTDNVYFELNPSFVLNYKHLSSMARYQFITLRDGFYGIFYFFLKNPKPLHKLETIFLVPKKFDYLVPTHWKENVLLYSFEYLTDKSQTDKTIVFGAISSDNFFLSSVEEKVRGLVPTKNELILATQIKERSFFNHKDETDLTINFIGEIHKKFGFDIDYRKSLIDSAWNSIDQSYSFTNLDSDNFFITYDYLTELFASKGAANLQDKDSIVDETSVLTRIALSPYHNILIEEPDSLGNEILTHLVDLKLSSVPINYSSVAFYEYAKNAFQKKYLSTEK
jgi:hypothetical protein